VVCVAAYCGAVRLIDNMLLLADWIPLLLCRPKAINYANSSIKI
jgi:hypothetical protein